MKGSLPSKSQCRRVAKHLVMFLGMLNLPLYYPLVPLPICKDTVQSNTVRFTFITVEWVSSSHPLPWRRCKGWGGGRALARWSLQSHPPFYKGPSRALRASPFSPGSSARPVTGKCPCISSCQVVSLGPQLIIPHIWEMTDAFVIWFRCPKGLDLIMSWANTFSNP